mgnify:CR=1 FL=1
MSPREAIVEDLRRLGLPMVTRGPRQASVLVTVDGAIMRSIAGPPREIATDVRWILAGIICGDAPDGSVMTHTAPVGAARSWTKRGGRWCET